MRYKYRKNDFNRKLTKKEKDRYTVAVVVFVAVFVGVLTYNFFSNCVFEWPIRWDVGTCFNEQIKPAKDNAAEKAAQFI